MLKPKKPSSSTTGSRETGQQPVRVLNRYRTAFTQVNVALALIDLEGGFLEGNQAAAELFGFRVEEFKGKSLQDLWLPEERRHLHRELKRVVRSKKSKGAHERLYRLSSGRLVSVEIAWTLVRGTDGKPTHFIASFRDITEIKRNYELLSVQASTDLLTGALNRGRVEERAGFELLRADRYREKLSLIMIDLDRFKRVNDRYGHNMGDRVLRGFCDTARSCLRATDLLGRWGGEEFVILLPGTGIHGAEQLAERLREAMEASRFEDQIRVTASLGVATYRGRETLSTLISRADQALYRAKQAGRNRVVVDVEDLEREMAHLQRVPRLATLSEFGAGLGRDVEVNAEHREIFRLANLLILVASEQKIQACSSSLVDELIRQLETHFAAEERLLEASGYPDAQAHREAHRVLMAALNQSIRDEESPESAVAAQAGDEIRDELSRHIFNDDRKYLIWLQGQ